MSMKKRSIKIVSILVIALALVMMIGNVVFADLNSGGYLDPSKIDPSKANQEVVGITQDVTNTVIGVIQIVGITFAVAMLIFVAIKYLTSAAEGKAEIKKYAVAYIVGAVLLFGATGILQIFKSFADTSINK